MWRRLIVAALFIIISDTLSAQGDEVSIVNADTLHYEYTPLKGVTTASQRFDNFAESLATYMTEGIATQRPVNFTIIGGPGYSAETGLRLSAVGNMRYRTYGNEMLSHNLSLRIMASLRGAYGVDIDGVNYIANSRNRLKFSVAYASVPTLMYGFDYDTSASCMAGSYTAKRGVVEVRYDRRIGEVFDIGLCADYRYDDARDIDVRARKLLGDRATLYHGAGVGIAAAVHHKHTEAINVIRGVEVLLEATMRPAFMGNTTTSLWQFRGQVDWYQPLWYGGLVALDLYGEYHSQATPWQLLARLGDDCRMRGYYPGQYNGNSLITTQLEVRQHIWEGLVGVLWGGAGVVWSEHDSVAWRKVLPNYGAGIRWYLSLSTAIRIDVGFGRGCYNFVVGMNESF